MIVEDTDRNNTKRQEKSSQLITKFTNLVTREARSMQRRDAMPHPLRRLHLRSTPLPQFFPGGAAASATAYAPSASAPVSPGHELPTLLLFFVLLLAFLFFLLDFLLHDIFRCFCRRSTLRKRRNGIDPAVLSSFPVVLYDVVRTRCGPDCAVCLAEFEDNHEVKPVSVRVLTVCGHVFHSDCIDIWLESHVTCPICRSDLRNQPDEAIMKALLEAQESGANGERGKIEEMQGDEVVKIG